MEVTHVYAGPSVLAHRELSSLAAMIQAVQAQQGDTQSQLEALQAQVNDLAFELYGLSDADRAIIQGTSQEVIEGEGEELEGEVDDGEDDAELAVGVSSPEQVARSLISYCVGLAFGRWDARLALNATLLPKLAGAFDPLPRVPPAGLVNAQGLPAQDGVIASVHWLRSRHNVLDVPPAVEGDEPGGAYPLEVAWDGVLTVDASSSLDLTTRVRHSLRLLFNERAAGVEAELITALQAGGRSPKTLEDYLSKTFFEDHVKTYSMSRRKAPIYWLLASSDKTLNVYLYAPRVTNQSLWITLDRVARPRLTRLETQLQALQTQQAAATGPAARTLAVEARALEGELRSAREFTLNLEAAAGSYHPNPNDGTTINLALLHTLTPWKEAHNTHKNLSKYTWASANKPAPAAG